MDVVALAADDANVFFGGYAGLGLCPKSGCASPTMLTTFPYGRKFVESIASDGTTVYWAERASPGAIRSCAVSGCATPTVVATTVGASTVAVDEQRVYWSDTGAAGEIGTVSALPK